MNVTLYEKFHILALSIVGLVATQLTPQQESAVFIVIITAILLLIIIVIIGISYLIGKTRDSP